MKHLKDNYDFSVPLRCIVCGSDNCFEFNDDKSFVKCTKCGKEYRLTCKVPCLSYPKIL